MLLTAMIAEQTENQRGKAMAQSSLSLQPPFEVEERDQAGHIVSSYLATSSHRSGNVRFIVRLRCEYSYGLRLMPAQGAEKLQKPRKDTSQCVSTSWLSSQRNKGLS